MSMWFSLVIQLNVFQAMFLGIIQGITEWLPVSSSGHLAIAQNYMGLELPVAFDVMLHAATLLVILVVFRKDIKAIIGAALRRDFRSPDGRTFILIVVAGIPTAVLGLAFRGYFESMFTSMFAVGAALLVTGFILATSRLGRGNRTLGYKTALLIGALQGLAVAPGISRSGATIGAGLFAGIKREAAIRFSFILAAPTILAATLLKLDELALSGISPEAMAFGFVASLAAGYASLKLLIRAVMQKKFSWFAVYCFVLGAVLLLASVYTQIW